MRRRASDRDPYRAPPDGWDPYGGRRRRWWTGIRVVRVGIVALVGTLAFGRDLVWLFEPSASPPPATSPSPRGALTPDPRTKLPRRAAPFGSPATWLDSADYPAAALRESVTGNVTMRFVIDPDGRVRHCATAASSGSPLLDTTACGVWMLRARYWPARDVAGHAVSQTSVQRVRWQIPAD